MLDHYEEEMKQGDYGLAKSVMNIAATTAAIAIKQYDEMRKTCEASNADR